MDRPYVATADELSRTLLVEGTLDETSTPRFREELFAFVDAADAQVTVELSQVEYLLSVAIATLAAALRRGEDEGVPVLLRAEAGTIAARVLEICGLPYDEPPAGSTHVPGGGTTTS